MREAQVLQGTVEFVGAGLTVIGFATISPAVVGIGAGTLVAAGLIAVYFALAGSRLTVEQERVPTDDISIAPLTPDPNPDNRRHVWPPRTSRKIPD